MRRRRASLVEALRIKVHATWLAARDPRTPRAARLVGLLVAAYALSPIDLIPDFIPVLGLVDDALIVPLGLWLFLRLVPPELFAEHEAEAAAADPPRVRSGVLIVLFIWASLALLVWAALSFAYA